jgi:Secretion system C-terminal sorting domain
MLTANSKTGLFISAMLLCCHIAVAQTGCTDPAATNYTPGATVNDGSCLYPVTHKALTLKGYFAAALTESSGLVWTDGKLWSHGDSGNPAEIYSVDTTDGHTLQTVVIDNYPNTDWEDITADSSYIYIANTGNNSGDRTDLSILKIRKSDITGAPVVHLNAQAISYSYTDQTSFVPSGTHNFDCESVISIKDSLYIFTKDRGDLQTRVYKLPKTPGTYAVSPYTSYNVDGLITGADYDPVNKEVVLVGYFSGHTNSFMWFLNDFHGDMFFSGNKRRIEIGSAAEWQTEGVCYISNHRFFVSCETSGLINASFYASSENWGNSTYFGNIGERSYTSYYPNPAKDFIHIVPIGDLIDYKIFSITGVVVQEGILTSVGNHSIPVKDLHQGTYILELTGNDHGRSLQMIVKE